MKIDSVILITLLVAGCGREYERDTSSPPPPTVQSTPTPLPLPTPTPNPTPVPLETPDPFPLELEVEELRLVVRTLAEENRRLRELLAAPPAEMPPPRSTFTVRPEATPVPRPTEIPQVMVEPEIEAPAENTDLATVLYVNPNWHYLVMDQGTEDGFANQDTLDILRQGSAIATAIITEAKPGQSVAEINLDSMGTSGLYPRKTDKVRKK